MRNEDLKVRLSQVDFTEIKHRVETWREDRNNYTERSPKKKKATRKAGVKKQDKLMKSVKDLSPEQAAALLKELGGG